MTPDREHLQDVLDTIGRIERHLVDRETFDQDELVQVWMVFHLQVIGQAARRVSDSLRNRHPEVPWALIIGMRNVLVHDYDQIDTDIVWSTISQDIPELKPRIIAMIAELEGDAE